jgi:Rap1a immunity proteins
VTCRGTEEMMVAGDRTTYTRTSWHAGFDPDRVLGRLARTARAVAIAITIVSLASAVRSESQELPVGFQERCRPSTLNVSAECFGYALGIYDAMHAVQMSGERLFGLRACAPPGMMDERVRELMIRFATTHPESQRYSAARQIGEAFSDAFPCPPVVADDITRRFRVRPAGPDEKLP